MKKAFIISILSVILLSPFVMYAQQAQQADAEGSLVHWMTLKEAMEKSKVQPKPIIMDFYTDWCGWCKKMMQTTYANPDLALYINSNFYPVKFNAETKDTIEYLGKKYGPVGDGPRQTNALAVKFLQNKLMYPSTLFLNNLDKQKNDFVFSMLAQGYLENNKLEPILVFTLENIFRNSSYEDFKVQFDKSFFGPTTDERLKEIKWLKPAAAFVQGKDSTEKKRMILIHTDWCNGCKVMYRTSFTDSATKKYIQDKFDLVDFNPEVTDTIVFKNQMFTNPHTPQMPFHQLAAALCRNGLTLPTLVVMDEKMNVIDAIPYYLNPEVLKKISVYYGDNIYKTKLWNDYIAGK